MAVSIAPSSPFDVAAQISAGVQRMTMPPIPPLDPTRPMPEVPSTPSAGSWFCKTFPNSLLCKSGEMTPSPGGGPSQPPSGTGQGSSLCSIPLIGSYACDLGQRAAFVVLAIMLIAIGAYVLIGGGMTRIDISQVTKAAKAVAA